MEKTIGGSTDGLQDFSKRRASFGKMSDVAVVVVVVVVVDDAREKTN